MTPGFSGPVLCTAIFAVLLAAGCAAPSGPGAGDQATTTTGEPQRGGVLRTSYTWDPPHWDKDLIVSYQTQIVTNFIYSKLLTYKTGPGVDPYSVVLEPEAAERWEVKDPTTYLVHLRKGVKFQNKPPVNGRELTAEDVKASFTRILDPNTKSPNRVLWDLVSSVDVVDPYTVRFTTKEPFAPFFTFIASDYGQLLPKELAQKPDLKRHADNIGSGPWVLESYEPSVQYVWKRNPDYWKQDRPYLDGVTITIIKERAAEIAALKAAELDVANVSGERADVDSVKASNPNMGEAERMAGSWARLYMRTDKPPFDDVRVRQALAMSIDRKGLINAVYGGHARPEGIIPAHLGDFHTPPDRYPAGVRKYWEHNPQEASRLMREAGYPEGVSLKMETTLIYSHPWPAHVEALVGQLRKGPFKVEVAPKEYGAYIATTYVGNFEGLAFGLTTPPADPDEIVYAFYAPGHPRNAGHVNDLQVTELVKQQRQTIDRAERIKFMKEKVEPVLAEKLYYIPTINGITWTLWHPWVKNYSGPHSTPAYGASRWYEQVWLSK